MISSEFLTPDALSPEQQNAFQIYVEHRDKLHTLLHFTTYIKNTPSLLPSNFVAASYYPYKKSKLPREPHWAWNQSNAKVTVKDDDEIITMRKISPRKKSGVAVAPSFKIWLFQIQQPTLPEQFFLWCEKGVEGETPTTNITTNGNEGITTEIGVIYPNQISVDSLSFLAPFIDEKCAEEFGWKESGTSEKSIDNEG